MTTVKAVVYKDSQFTTKIKLAAEQAMTKALIDFIEIFAEAAVETLSRSLDRKKTQE